MYGQNSLKVQDSEEKPAFLLRLLLRSHIAQLLAMFSVDPGILLSLYASTLHPHTTLATGDMSE